MYMLSSCVFDLEYNLSRRNLIPTLVHPNPAHSAEPVDKHRIQE